MKFWVLAEVSSNYIYNIFPYLGVVEKEQQNGRLLAENVVMILISNLDRNGGYNITTDYFFTSVRLAGSLSQQNITIVRTIHADTKRLPREITEGQKRKFSSKFFYNSAKTVSL